MQENILLNLWEIFCKCLLVDQYILVIFEKLTSINQVLSVLKQIEIYFSTSLLNHNYKCYYKINLDAQVLSHFTYCILDKLSSKFLFEKHSSESSY